MAMHVVVACGSDRSATLEDVCEAVTTCQGTEDFGSAEQCAALLGPDLEQSTGACANCLEQASCAEWDAVTRDLIRAAACSHPVRSAAAARGVLEADRRDPTATRASIAPPHAHVEVSGRRLARLGERLRRPRQPDPLHRFRGQLQAHRDRRERP